MAPVAPLPGSPASFLGVPTLALCICTLLKSLIHRLTVVRSTPRNPAISLMIIGDTFQGFPFLAFTPDRLFFVLVDLTPVVPLGLWSWWFGCCGFAILPGGADFSIAHLGITKILNPSSDSLPWHPQKPSDLPLREVGGKPGPPTHCGELVPTARGHRMFPLFVWLRCIKQLPRISCTSRRVADHRNLADLVVILPRCWRWQPTGRFAS